MRILLLAVLILGCSKSAPAPDRPVEAGARPAALHVRSFARFSKGQLQQCVDVVGEDTSAELERALAKEQPITLPCAKAFADRISLAVCTVDAVRVSHYDFADVGLSDVAMSECLSTQGQWDPISRSSSAFRKAKLEHAQRQLHAATEGLRAAASADHPER